MQKEHVVVPTLEPDGSLGALERMADACVVQAGASRRIETELPFFRLVHGDGDDVRNLPAGLAAPFGIDAAMPKDHAMAYRYIHQAEILRGFHAFDDDELRDICRSWRLLPQYAEPAVMHWDDSVNTVEKLQLQAKIGQAWTMLERKVWARAGKEFETAARACYSRYRMGWMRALHGLLRVAFGSGALTEARPVLVELMKWQPNAPPDPNWEEIYYLAAQIAVSLDDRAEALRCYGRILKSSPNHPLILQELEAVIGTWRSPPEPAPEI